jgi:cell division protein FtsL
MSATDFEYAIKKDVRNNPIVREVDEARQQQLLRAVGIGGLLVAVLLFSAWQHFELLQHGYLMERLLQERKAEEEVNRHLKLEIETLRAPRRIEDMATRKLRMVAPAPGAVVIIERVAIPAPPAKSIVAAR